MSKSEAEFLCQTIDCNARATRPINAAQMCEQHWEGAVFDEIERPKHYNSGKIECWDYIVDQDMGYLDGCVVKYVTRFRRKGTPVKDLRKAQAYLDRLIIQVEKEEGL